MYSIYNLLAALGQLGDWVEQTRRIIVNGCTDKFPCTSRNHVHVECSRSIKCQGESLWSQIRQSCLRAGTGMNSYSTLAWPILLVLMVLHVLYGICKASRNSKKHIPFPFPFPVRFSFSPHRVIGPSGNIHTYIHFSEEGHYRQSLNETWSLTFKPYRDL